jgi:hypothetical protein
MTDVETVAVNVQNEQVPHDSASEITEEIED